MRHKKYEEMIVLALYEELGEKEKSDLEQHVRNCLRCSQFRTGITKIFTGREEGPLKVSEKVIRDSRTQFADVMVKERGGRKNAQRVFVFPREPRWRPVPVYAMAIAGLLIFALGAVSSYLFVHRQLHSQDSAGSVVAELASGNMNDRAITDVRFVESDRKSGQVEFSFNLVRRYEMKGSLDDRNVQKILAFALVNSDNPGVRLRTISMLDASPKADKDIVDALIKAVETDDNPGVRREALLSLNKFPFDSEIKKALLFILQNDKNPGMRVAAINFLSREEMSASLQADWERRPDSQLLNVLKERSSADPNKYVRIKATDMLKEYKEL